MAEENNQKTTSAFGFNTRAIGVLEEAIRDGLFLARNMTPLADTVNYNENQTDAVCSAYFSSSFDTTGIINIMWKQEAGPNPFSVFAYAGRECKLKKGVSFDQLCTRCFQVNHDTPLTNVSYRIDELERFQKEGKGYIVVISGLPLLPFETKTNYRDGGTALETLFVGAMESALAADAMTPVFFQDIIE